MSRAAGSTLAVPAVLAAAKQARVEAILADRATPNLPSADFERTAAFYAALGFETAFRDDGWMILHRGAITIEFFPHDVDPLKSIASCCIRVHDLDGLYGAFSKVGLSESCCATPRIGAPHKEVPGLRIFYMVDPDGNLIRCLEDRSSEASA